jgi:hypothetical protein
MPLSGAEGTVGLTWRKASFCQSGECIEVARLGAGGILVRDSKQPDKESLSLTPEQWRSLLSGIKSGQYRHLSR